MINSAQYFDVATDRLLMATGHWTTHEQMEDGLLKYGFGTQMWQFVRQLALMSLHDIEFALLTAICILSPGLYISSSVFKSNERSEYSYIRLADFLFEIQKL